MNRLAAFKAAALGHYANPPGAGSVAASSAVTTSALRAHTERGRVRTPVGVEPWRVCLLSLLPILLAWLLVVVLGRVVCLAAQRVPPLVLLVRAVRRSRDASVRGGA